MGRRVGGDELWAVDLVASLRRIGMWYTWNLSEFSFTRAHGGYIFKGAGPMIFKVVAMSVNRRVEVFTITINFYALFT